MTTRPIPTARGRRFGAGGRRECRVRETCRRAAPNRVRNASLHSTLVEGIGATLATTAGTSASPRRVGKRHRLHLSSTITLGPWHVERMQFRAARAFVASMRKLAPAWGSPARREDLAKPLRASRLVRTSTKRRVRTHSVPRHPDWSLAANWRDFARLSSAARAKRGETNGADPPRTTFARPRHQHRRDAAHTTHPNHGPKCEKLPGRVRETSTNRNARTARGAPQLAAGHSSIATTGARDAHQLLTARRPDSSAFRRTRAHDVAAKGRTRPNVRRL